MADGAKLDFPYRRLEKMLRELGGEASLKELERAMAKVGDAYEAEAVALAPHDTGFLENSSTVRTRRAGSTIRTEVGFTANYAAEVHELPPARRGRKTRAKPSTKFGAPGPKFLERVLRGMDLEMFAGKALREVLKEAADRARRRGGK
jgi:hypothetical protein